MKSYPVYAVPETEAVYVRVPHAHLAQSNSLEDVSAASMMDSLSAFVDEASWGVIRAKLRDAGLSARIADNSVLLPEEQLLAATAPFDADWARSPRVNVNDPVGSGTIAGLIDQNDPEPELAAMARRDGPIAAVETGAGEIEYFRVPALAAYDHQVRLESRPAFGA